MSTLRAVVESGLGIEIDQAFGGLPATRTEVHVRLARDVEVTAELLARLPLRVRRPVAQLVREVTQLDARRTPAIARAAERRRPYAPGAHKPRGRA